MNLRHYVVLQLSLRYAMLQLITVILRSVTITLPLHYYSTVKLPSHYFITITLPSHYYYITIKRPSLSHYIIIKLPLCYTIAIHYGHITIILLLNHY